MTFLKNESNVVIERPNKEAIDLLALARAFSGG